MSKGKVACQAHGGFHSLLHGPATWGRICYQAPLQPEGDLLL